MHLIAPLIAGVRGAENGHVELYRRGTSTRATWYSDFEGSSSDSTGADIDLDSNGGAVVFVNELVRCVAKDSDGSVIRDFVAGHSAPALEYQGQSFTGTDYESGASGAGSGYPATVQAILDKWKDSAGTTNWQVLLGDSAVNIDSALSGLSGMFFNVQGPDYGAVGDNVTDDTAAIAAAITAAATDGGIVFFPPGTYRITSALTLSAKVSLLGCGPNASAITLDHASNNLLATAGSTTYDHQLIEGLRFTASQANTGNPLSLVAGTKIAVRNCYIGGANNNGNLVATADSSSTVFSFEGCTFQPASNASSIRCAGAIKRGSATRCRFITPAAHTPADGVVYGRAIDLERCVFELSASTSGTLSCYKANSTTLDATVTACQFGSSGGATVTAIELGTYTSTSQFVESDNVFGASNVTAYSYTVEAASSGAIVHLVTRERRVQRISNNDVAPTLDTDQYGTIIVTRTGLGDQAWSANMPPDGARGIVVAYQASGAGASTDTGPGASATGVTGFKKYDANSILSNGTAAMYMYQAAIINSTLCLISTATTAVTDGTGGVGI